MKIALAAATGHIGSKLAPRLLDGGADLVLLCRDPKKVTALTARGAKAEAGDLKDGEYVRRATQGVDAIFWLTPPDFVAPDMYAFQTDLARNAARAIQENGIKRVVNLSSIGGQLQSGTGPVAGLHRVENLLHESGASVTHLRPGYFLENYLFSLDSIRSAGSVFLPVQGDRRLPMVATQDIAARAAACFLDPSWTGSRVLGIHGPKDMSFDEAAGILGDVLGRPVRHVTVTPDQTREAFLSMGASPDVAAKYVEMYRAIDEGTFKVAEPRTSETTTPTTFVEFARTVMKPLLS
jgi:uncharacterized protein YbjT (DUF2867 family)